MIIKFEKWDKIFNIQINLLILGNIGKLVG